MAKNKSEDVKQGLPAWMGTYGDMVTLLLCFFVLLFSMSSVDAKKFKEALAPFNDRLDVLPGGAVLTDGESINNGVNQMDDIQTALDKAVLKKLNKIKENDYKSNKADERKKEEIIKKALEESKKVYKKVDDYITKEGLNDKVEINYSLNYVKLTLEGGTLFDPGKAKIKDVGYEVVDKISDVLNRDDFKDFLVQIEGHTDNVPIHTQRFNSNWELSAARAISVGNYLIENKGISESKIACTGYGEYRPIAPNDTKENRAKNRRVEIKLILNSIEVAADEYVD